MNEIFEREPLNPKQIARDSARVAATSKLRAACDQFAAAIGDAAHALGKDDAHTLAVSFLGTHLGLMRGLGVGVREGERVAAKLVRRETLVRIKRQDMDNDEEAS